VRLVSENENVAEVLARLKEEVRRRQDPSLRCGDASQPPALGSGDASQPPALQPSVGGGLGMLRQVYATTRVNPHLPIGWPRLPAGILPKITTLVQKMVRRLLRWYINPIVEQQNAYNAAVTAALETLVLQAERYRQTSFNDIETSKLRLQRLERALRAAQEPRASGAATEAGPVSTARRQSIDYFHLELKFRGSPQLIKERQSAYLEFFRGQQDVLDVGCGRGEFVQLLSENGIRAQGIDLDADTVAYAAEHGIAVQQAEAVPHLDSLTDGSLGGIFCAQVIEHLSLPYLLRFLELCYDKLAPGAPLILETINPTSLHALSNSFLMDPTHVRPIHPETLKFVLESSGFWRMQVRYLSPVPMENRLLAFPEHTKLRSVDEEAVSLLNHNIEVVNHSLFGYQDYAVIAWKPSADLGEAA